MSLKRLIRISLLLATALTIGSMCYREGAGLYNLSEVYCANQPGCVTPDLISRGWPYPIVTLSALQDTPSNYLKYLNWAGLLEDFGLAVGLGFLVVLFASRIPRVWRFIRTRPKLGTLLLRSLIAAPLLVILSFVVVVIPPPPSQCKDGIYPGGISTDSCLVPTGHRGWPLPVSLFYSSDDSFPTSFDSLVIPGILLDLGAAYLVSVAMFSIVENKTGKLKNSKRS